MIRLATTDDATAIVDFQLAMAMETENLALDKPTLVQGVAAAFNDSTKGFYLVYEQDNEVVASLMVTFEWSDWRNGTVWWIQSVYVKPAFRRQGIYQKMYAFLKEKVMHEKDIRGLRLYVDMTNHAAQKTYAALGMNGDHYQLYEWMK